MLREFLKIQSGLLWKTSKAGLEKTGTLAAWPIRMALTAVPVPVRVRIEDVGSQAQSALENAIGAAEAFQNRLVDSMAGWMTLRPVIETLEQQGLLQGKAHGVQRQPELEYLEAVNDAGPFGSTMLVVVLAMSYANLNLNDDGRDAKPTPSRRRDRTHRSNESASGRPERRAGSM